MAKIGSDSFPQSRPWDADQADEGLELYAYAMLVKPHLLKIIVCTFAAALTTGLLAVFALPHWYRAQAVLRPASQQTENQQAVMANASGVLSSLGSSVSSALGLGGNDNDAEEFMVILAAYDFNIHLIQKYQLQDDIVPPTRINRSLAAMGLKPYSLWHQFKKIQSRLDVNYDLQAGNLTLGFQDKNPARASQILGEFIDELRELLRKHAVNVAQVAVKSLNGEIAKTSDALLIQQLDQLVAQQLQAQLTAEMQSDFAFTVDDAPATAEVLYSPWIVLDSVIAAALTPLFCLVWLVFYEVVFKPQRALYMRRLAIEADGSEPEVSADESASTASVQRIRAR